MPEEIKRIIKTYMDSNAPRVEVNKNALVNANIRHQFVKTTLKTKSNDIISFLEKRGTQRGIIFCRTKAGTQNLANLLIDEGFSTAALEGDMQQKERDKVMRAFKKENLQYLVSTDVSARGIDVSGLEFVIHHQLPEQLEYYTHRSGRTARAGRTGTSLAFILANEFDRIQEIQKLLNIKFTEVSV
jgi:ATP-dependent RNA helicase DeaD